MGKYFGLLGIRKQRGTLVLGRIASWLFVLSASLRPMPYTQNFDLLILGYAVRHNMGWKLCDYQLAGSFC